MRTTQGWAAALAIGSLALTVAGCDQIRDFIGPDSAASASGTAAAPDPTTIHASGQVRFQAGWSFDLDDATQYNYDLDVHWRDACGPGPYCSGPNNRLLPVTSSPNAPQVGVAAAGSFDTLTLEQVRALPMSAGFDLDMGASWQAGAVIVYRTNQGRYGKLRVDTREQWSLTYSYLTWK
jgi:hypothetical protein